jgi:hypothetical protein
MTRSGAESYEPETMVLPDNVEPDTSNDAEVKAVFRLPSDLLAKVDVGIESGRWASRDAFARMAFAAAIGAHVAKGGDDGKVVRGGAAKRRLEGVGRDVYVRG